MSHKLATVVFLVTAAASLAGPPSPSATSRGTGGGTQGDTPVQDRAAPAPSTSELRTMTARFAPTDIGADVSTLPAAERIALEKMVQAARLMDALFLRQAWAGNDALLQELSRAVLTNSPDAAARPDFVASIYGPADIGDAPKDAPPLFAAMAMDDSGPLRP